MSAPPSLIIAALAGAALLGFYAGRLSSGRGDDGRRSPTAIDATIDGSPNGSTSPTALGAPGEGVQNPTGAGSRSTTLSLAHPTSKLSFDTINSRITAMDGDEMEALFNQLRSANDHPQQGLIESLLTVHLIARSPANMIAIKLAHPNLPVLGRTYQQWGQTDPEAALAHIESMENETWYRTGLSSIFSGMGRADPERALAALEANQELGGHHYGSLFGAWTVRSPADATAALDRVPAAHRGQALTSIANRYPEVDPAAARRWFGSLSAADAAIARPTFEGRTRQLELSTDPIQR